MLRKSKKSLAILLTLAMLATLFVGVPTASAATTYDTISTVVDFNPNTIGAADLQLATVYIKVDPSLGVKSSALIEVVDSEGSLLTMKSIKEFWLGSDGWEAISGDEDEGELLSAPTKSYKYSVTTAAYGKTEIKLDIVVDAKNCAAGEVKVRFSNAQGQLINGSVVAAYATGASVQVSALETRAFGDGGGDVTIRIQEPIAGGLKKNLNSLKFKLPVGFEWGDVSVTVIDGAYGANPVTSSNFNFNPDGRDLKVGFDTETTKALIADVKAKIKVADLTQAKYGDVTVAVSGESTVTPSELIVGSYGDYEVNVSSVSVETIQPGIYDQKIGKFAIEEALANTVIKDRTIILQLPEDVKWYNDEYPTFYADESTNYGNFKISGFEAVGTDKRTIKTTVSEASYGNKATKLVFKGGKITAAADFQGDIELTISGSAGVSGTVKVAEAKLPVNVETSSLPTVIIGQQNQVAADVTLTESKAEVLKSKTTDGKEDGYITISTPTGVRFSEIPTFSVVEGDVQLGTVVSDTDNSWAKVRVKGTSSKASEITISNIKLIVDRTVPEGDIRLKIGGSALIENNNDNYFPNENWVTEVAVANCITPAAAEEKVDATFVIGSTTYVVNGEEYTMDVAPYIKDSRTYMPLRYAAMALGVAEQNILWDAATQTATLIKGDKVVQVKIGSTVMLINGVSVNMDVAPEITNDRTMLPLRWIGQAFGADFTWDEATQTVYMNL